MRLVERDGWHEEAAMMEAGRAGKWMRTHLSSLKDTLSHVIRHYCVNMSTRKISYLSPLDVCVRENLH